MEESTDRAAVPASGRTGPIVWPGVASEITGHATGYAWVFAGVVVATYWLSARATGQPLTFPEDALANVGKVMAPLVLVAAFIERSVEVILTPWRGDESDLIEQRVQAQTASGNIRAAESEAVRLREHKNGTRRRAFMLAVSLGLAAALLGFRGIGSLVESAPDGGLFVFFDVLITGFVLGGGADGLHKPVKAFTDYMEMISKSAKSHG